MVFKRWKDVTLRDIRCHRPSAVSGTQRAERENVTTRLHTCEITPELCDGLRPWVLAAVRHGVTLEIIQARLARAVGAMHAAAELAIREEERNTRAKK
jgi:hypothetical protein